MATPLSGYTWYGYPTFGIYVIWLPHFRDIREEGGSGGGVVEAMVVIIVVVYSLLGDGVLAIAGPRGV